MSDGEQWLHMAVVLQEIPMKLFIAIIPDAVTGSDHSRLRWLSFKQDTARPVGLLMLDQR